MKLLLFFVLFAYSAVVSATFWGCCGGGNDDVYVPVPPATRQENEYEMDVVIVPPQRKDQVGKYIQENGGKSFSAHSEDLDDIGDSGILERVGEYNNQGKILEVIEESPNQYSEKHDNDKTLEPTGEYKNDNDVKQQNFNSDLSNFEEMPTIPEEVISTLPEDQDDAENFIPEDQVDAENFIEVKDTVSENGVKQQNFNSDLSNFEEMPTVPEEIISTLPEDEVDAENFIEVKDTVSEKGVKQRKVNSDLSLHFEEMPTVPEEIISTLPEDQVEPKNFIGVKETAEKRGVKQRKVNNDSSSNFEEMPTVPEEIISTLPEEQVDAENFIGVKEAAGKRGVKQHKHKVNNDSSSNFEEIISTLPEDQVDAENFIEVKDKVEKKGVGQHKHKINSDLSLHFEEIPNVPEEVISTLPEDQVDGENFIEVKETAEKKDVLKRWGWVDFSQHQVDSDKSLLFEEISTVPEDNKPKELAFTVPKNDEKAINTSLMNSAPTVIEAQMKDFSLAQMKHSAGPKPGVVNDSTTIAINHNVKHKMGASNTLYISWGDVQHHGSGRITDDEIAEMLVIRMMQQIIQENGGPTFDATLTTTILAYLEHNCRMLKQLEEQAKFFAVPPRGNLRGRDYGKVWYSKVYEKVNHYIAALKNKVRCTMV